MSSDRKRRRLAAKGKLKLLQGGRRPDEPMKQHLTGKGGTADFAVGLDTFCSAAAQHDPELTAQGILVALLTVSASMAIALEASEDDFSESARRFYQTEIEKRSGQKPPGAS